MAPLSEVDLLDPGNFLQFGLLFFFIIFLRYLVFSQAYHYLFFFLFKKQFSHRILEAGNRKRAQIKKEVYWAAWTSVIFSLATLGMIILWQRGYTAIYTDFSSFPLWYFFVSILVIIFLHETYYYWLHRWMHLPGIYPRFHNVHHHSIHTSALTSFSFHPIESFLQALIIPIILLFLPTHPYAILLVLLLMTISATINHAGVEIYPRHFQKHWLGKWVIGATHHDLHHKKFRFNYGLYFSFWDKWMHTESPGFEEKFEKMTG